MLVLIAALLLYFNPLPLLNQVSGRVLIDKTRMSGWAAAPFINNHKCQVSPIADACEDVKIHHRSSTAFLACGDPVERTHWFPPAQIRTMSKRKESSFKEKLFKYDLESGETTQLKIVGLEGDFANHGIDVIDVPGNDEKVRITAVIRW